MRWKDNGQGPPVMDVPQIAATLLGVEGRSGTQYVRARAGVSGRRPRLPLPRRVMLLEAFAWDNDNRTPNASDGWQLTENKRVRELLKKCVIKQ